MVKTPTDTASDTPTDTTATLDNAALRLASLLSSGRSAESLADPTLASLEFVDEISLKPLHRGEPPVDLWAVDGGQATVADARCVQVVVTRAARVRFLDGNCALEDEGALRAHVLGSRDDRIAALLTLGVDGLDPDTPVDVNLLRDRWEWEAVERCVNDCQRGGVVLVDGDLLADWRLPTSLTAGLLRDASAKGVLLAGITKHSSLSRGGAPLVGQLEMEAADLLGPRAKWWALVGRGEGIQVVVARLDPDARFAFRIDLPAGVDPDRALGQLAAVSDDAAFPGYPYPLTVADRLAACPGWLRQETWLQLDDLLERTGVALEVRERAFTDRHRLMERA